MKAIGYSSPRHSSELGIHVIRPVKISRHGSNMTFPESQVSGFSSKRYCRPLQVPCELSVLSSLASQVGSISVPQDPFGTVLDHIAIIHMFHYKNSTHNDSAFLAIAM